MLLHAKGKEEKLKQYKKVHALYEQGLSFEEIGNLFGHSREWASKVVKGKMKCQKDCPVEN